MENLLGIYEKALPQNLSWSKRLACAKELGFDFVEISIDETDNRLNRLYWSKEQKQDLRDAIWEVGIPILSMCFSGHRKYPMGSRSLETRQKAMELMEKAIDFASELGIRVIQLAGYDVYYEESGSDTKNYFLENLKRSVENAERKQVMLAVEIMDTDFINSITKYLYLDSKINSPWFTVYPDIGNLTAWNNDIFEEFSKGINKIVGVHVKETLPVTDTSPGVFKGVPFGKGTVDFQTNFQILRDLGYEGPYLIEMWSGEDENYIHQVREAKQFVLKKMAEVG